MAKGWLEEVKALAARKNSPMVGVLVLPGQLPGPRALEHDTRIRFGIEVWTQCCLYCTPYLITTADCRDKHGRTTAQYMRDQYVSLISATGWSVDDYVKTSEESSFHTAASFRHLREFFNQNPYDLIIMVSNSLHLWVARTYWKHLLPEVPMVTASSGSGHSATGGGALNMSYPKFFIREAVQYCAAMSIDWVLGGTLLDQLGYSKQLAAHCCQLEWPKIA